MAEQGQDMGSTVTPPSSRSLSSQRQLEKPEDPSLPKALGLLVAEGQALPCAAVGAGGIRTIPPAPSFSLDEPPEEVRPPTDPQAFQEDLCEE